MSHQPFRKASDYRIHLLVYRRPRGCIYGGVGGGKEDGKEEEEAQGRLVSRVGCKSQRRHQSSEYNTCEMDVPWRESLPASLRVSGERRKVFEL